MFKKRNRTKKTNLEDELRQELQESENELQPKQQQENDKNIIIKGKKKQVSGVNPKQLIAAPKKKVADGDQPQQSIDDMVGMIETKYLKENQDDNEDKLMNKFIEKSLKQDNINNLTPQQQQNEIEKTKQQRQELKEQIYKKEQEKPDLDQEILSYNLKNDNFISQGVSTTWQSGIMEIKVSLDQKAENMAKLEEMKRKELLKGVIVEEDYATRIRKQKEAEQNQKNLTKREEKELNKEFESFQQKFFKQGRAHTASTTQKQNYNQNIENF